MAISIFFITHWYASIFAQTFFNHRYAAHQQFTMNPFWEKFFYVFSFLSLGSSYLSAHVYAIMHRMHHAYTDTEKDPHSPRFDESMFAMMLRTRKIYLDTFNKKVKIDEKFTKNLPQWTWFDTMANMRIVRLIWILFYITIYIFLAEDQWWWYFLLPITIVMGPFHGVIVNWFAHKYGYRNYKSKEEDSTNLLPFDFLLIGECYHNNHHKFPANPNFGVKWFEIDLCYPFIKIFSWIGIIELRKS